MRGKGFAVIFILIAFLMTIVATTGTIFYFKSRQAQNKSSSEYNPLKLNATQGAKWKLINHTKEVSFQNIFDGKQVYSGRSFIDMQSNGAYWLLGRGDSNSSLDHFYKYDSKGFANLSQKFIDMDQIWHIAWNDDYWLLGNSNYVFTKSQLVRYDGKDYSDLTEQFRKTPCHSTYEGHINLSKILAFKSGFLIVSNTDLNSCYALYNGSKFQNISDNFPLHPKDSGLIDQRVLYSIGDCHNQVCYLASESGGDLIAKYDIKLNKVDLISISDLTGGNIKDAIVSQIKVNNNGEWIFELASFDIKNKSSKYILLNYDSSNRSSKVLYQKDGDIVGQESITLEGWDPAVSKWVILTSKCSGEDKKICSFSINQLEGDKLSKIPVDLPESSNVPTVRISSGDYLISYKDQLFEAKLE